MKAPVGTDEALNFMPQPGSPDDVRCAARLVVEGLVPQETMMAVLAKQKELIERGRPLSVLEICVRKSWITVTEARWCEAGDAPPKDLLPGLELGPRLGVGGMSHVYRAKDASSQAPVAVKILLPRLARDAVARSRFEAESELLCRLQHESLVRGFYHYSVDGVHYLVMELVDGCTALEQLDRKGPFSEEAALEIILQAARALEYLHQQGLVHRDVKPGNLLITRTNQVKLCDLGFAVAAGHIDSNSGTVQYLAPEQAVGERVLDTRADIYALGVTLFQLTMGKLPFEGATDEEQLSKRVFEELRAKELKGIGVSQHLHYFIQKMMARERDVRYQTPAALIADIEESLEGRSRQEKRTFGRRNDGSKVASRLNDRRRG
jgi:serine/threonine-protein kinase